MKRTPIARGLGLVLAAALTMSLVLPTHAGPVRNWFKVRRAQRQAAQGEDDGGFAGLGRGTVAAVPADVRVTRDLAYGGDPAERFDVYAPRAGSSGASVIFMVHSGGWKHGDKGVAA
ncbi:hypothetical protein [Massilia sp. Se16.2.3]|uniref:hypothetical protein n=1 Tax=Massilia sp. Se16.2.3 TaxID=2709303 RepID=UPI0015FF0B53|nr:hypothetical protein [Massilia sp. Se16.2.3]QNB00942.1 hypothetical protein G4G31_22555 [Massilia sp. Se16.2.3]